MDHNGIDSSVPLKFEDIVDKKIYDKMRPPKPGGKWDQMNDLMVFSLAHLSKQINDISK